MCSMIALCPPLRKTLISQPLTKVYSLPLHIQLDPRHVLPTLPLLMTHSCTPTRTLDSHHLPLQLVWDCMSHASLSLMLSPGMVLCFQPYHPSALPKDNMYYNHLMALSLQIVIPDSCFQLHPIPQAFWGPCDPHSMLLFPGSNPRSLLLLHSPFSLRTGTEYILQTLDDWKLLTPQKVCFWV